MYRFISASVSCAATRRLCASPRCPHLLARRDFHSTRGGRSWEEVNAFLVENWQSVKSILEAVGSGAIGAFTMYQYVLLPSSHDFHCPSSFAHRLPGYKRQADVSVYLRSICEIDASPTVHGSQIQSRPSPDPSLERERPEEGHRLIWLVSPGWAFKQRQELVLSAIGERSSCYRLRFWQRNRHYQARAVGSARRCFRVRYCGGFIPQR